MIFQEVGWYHCTDKIKMSFSCCKCNRCATVLFVYFNILLFKFYLFKCVIFKLCVKTISDSNSTNILKTRDKY